MGDVGREPPLAGLSRRERGDLLLERLGHLVERLGPRAELVLPLDRQPRLQEALGERMGRLARARDGPQRPPCQNRTGKRGEQDEDPAADQQAVAEHQELVPEALLREEVVELGLLAHGPADDQVVRPRDRAPLVRELLVPHEPAQRERDLLEPEVQARGKLQAALDADGVEATRAPVGLEQLRRPPLQVERSDPKVAPGLLRGGVDRAGQ